MDNSDYSSNINNSDHPFKQDFPIKADNDLGLQQWESRTGGYGRQEADLQDHNDHSDSPVGQSFYTWEAFNLINGLEQVPR